MHSTSGADQGREKDICHQIRTSPTTAIPARSQGRLGGVPARRKRERPFGKVLRVFSSACFGLRNFALVIAAIVFSSAAFAQDYRFSVPTMNIEVVVQPDASAIVQYVIEFKNEPGAHAIDVVDIGLPHGNYNIRNMRASIDEVQLQDIRKSTYIKNGVEIHLKQHAIRPGKSGRFMFQATMPDMVWLDTTDKTYASIQIIPTWFDPQSQIGRTQFNAAIHLLPGVDAEKVKYQNENHKYTDLVLYGAKGKNYPVAVWQYDSIQLSDKNPKLAVSFPKDGMQRVVSIGPFGLLLKWFRENPEAQILSGIGLLALFAFAFFRFTHGTGCAVFAMVVGLMGLVLAGVPPLHFIVWPSLIGLTLIVERWLGQKKKTRTKSYLPAMATVEGGGIKRGLTAPQAGVLLELPISKTLTLVIFGLLKKGIIEKVQDDPLEVQVNPDYLVDRKSRLRIAGERGMVLHDYEHAFIDRLQKHKGPVKECDLNEPLGGLIKTVANRMAGFDLSETKEYYRQIIKRAWTEADSIGEIEKRDDVLDRNYEWILLDDNWTDVFKRWSRGGYDYQPRWDRFPRRRGSGPIIIMGGDSRPAGGWSPSPGGKGSGGGDLGGRGTGTSLGEVAASFAGWTENTMGSLVSAIEPAKFGLTIPQGGGILDLSGVDRVTADVFKAIAAEAAKGGGGHGGGGGGCACACAGCACACACAGGGR